MLATSTDTIHVHTQKMATGNYTLPPPPALEIHDLQAAEKWKKFKRAWDNYSLATELNKKSEAIQVATLLTVIGEEAREVFSTFSWTSADDSAKIKPVLKKFEEYCQLCKNVPFERYRFNRGVFIRRNGTMEWNGGMEWNGTVEWNGMERSRVVHYACADCVIFQFSLVLSKSNLPEVPSFFILRAGLNRQPSWPTQATERLKIPFF